MRFYSLNWCDDERRTSAPEQYIDIVSVVVILFCILFTLYCSLGGHRNCFITVEFPINSFTKWCHGLKFKPEEYYRLCNEVDNCLTVYLYLISDRPSIKTPDTQIFHSMVTAV